MIKENQSGSRSAFIKKASLALVSVFGVGIVGLSFQKLNPFSDKGIDALSKKEANEIIKNMKSSNVKKIKPEAPPQREQENIGE